MNKDQTVTFNLVLVLVLVVVLIQGAGRFFSVILADILTYHPTQLKLTPDVPSIGFAIPGVGIYNTKTGKIEPFS